LPTNYIIYVDDIHTDTPTYTPSDSDIFFWDFLHSLYLAILTSSPSNLSINPFVNPEEDIHYDQSEHLQAIK
jgi:hypothetical protein